MVLHRYLYGRLETEFDVKDGDCFVFSLKQEMESEMGDGV